MSEKYDYDVIIIGAGIGGLVCGCYLAKAGLKTLIVEKNRHVGGYCSSFTSQGYFFDSCAHALSSLRDGGMLNRILSDLDLIDQLNVLRPNPTEILVTLNSRIPIYHNTNHTIKEFQIRFPQERYNISKFFNYLTDSAFIEIAKLKNKTFASLLSENFSNLELINLFSTVIFLLVGIPSTEVSAVVGCLLWREFIFDGGYYPNEGMKSFSDLLYRKFGELGGKSILSEKTINIPLSRNKATGVILNNKQHISGRHIVSACDARQTFFELIEKKSVNTNYLKLIEKMHVASSVFLLYLGLDKYFAELEILKSNIYATLTNNFEIVYSSFLESSNKHFAITSPTVRSPNISNNVSVCIASNAIYKNSQYWHMKKKNEFAELLLQASEKIIPGIKKHVSFKG